MILDGYTAGEEVNVVFHMIEFNVPLPDPELREEDMRPRSDPLRVRRVTRALVKLRPYVVTLSGDLVEVADLHFEDGTVAHQVPYARFHFVD